jgi:hypothetical protein
MFNVLTANKQRKLEASEKHKRDYDILSLEKGTDLLDLPLCIHLQDAEGNTTTISFKIHKDCTEKDIRLTVNGREFFCEESIMCQRISSLIEEVRIDDDGGVRLSAVEHGSVVVDFEEIAATLHALSKLRGTSLQVGTSAQVNPKPGSLADHIHTLWNNMRVYVSSGGGQRAVTFTQCGESRKQQSASKFDRE